MYTTTYVFSLRFCPVNSGLHFSFRLIKSNRAIEQDRRRQACCNRVSHTRRTFRAISIRSKIATEKASERSYFGIERSPRKRERERETREKERATERLHSAGGWKRKWDETIPREIGRRIRLLRTLSETRPRKFERELRTYRVFQNKPRNSSNSDKSFLSDTNSKYK